MAEQPVLSAFIEGRIDANKAGIFNGMPNGGFLINGLWYNYHDKNNDMKAVQEFIACYQRGSFVSVQYHMEATIRVIDSMTLLEGEPEEQSEAQEGQASLIDMLDRAKKDGLTWTTEIVLTNVVKASLFKDSKLLFTAHGEAGPETVRGDSKNYLALAETRAVKRVLRWYYGGLINAVQ